MTKKGEQVSIDGQPYTVVWSSDEMTDAERYESHMRTADFMESWGLSGAFQRHLAEQYHPKPPAQAQASADASTRR